LDPAAAAGLEACTEAQVGLGNMEDPKCPPASKVGTVEVTTPLLPHTLSGSVYLATQDSNPFHSTVAAYIVIRDTATGVLVKIPGKIEVDESGTVRGVFDEAPQLPFSELKLRFFGGTRGDVMTPQACGRYGISGVFTPWSGLSAAVVEAEFTIAASCGSSFAPSFAAGTASPRAGAYSPFELEFGREDREQELEGLTITLPGGLAAKLAGVAECSDSELAIAANSPGRSEQAHPSCPGASAVGSVHVQAGPGPTPLNVTGTVYLTGPYRGAPYGLAAVVPAIAGPFDFGTVVVRQALNIDANDAHVTVVSDPFPYVLHVKGADGTTAGFPLRLRRISAKVDRPDFIINPTSCAEKEIEGVGTSVTGVKAPLKTRFQASDCALLKFKPVFKASTSGKTSRANGASLSVKLSYPKASFGTQANIRSVKVDLPRQLPSRLPTLQKACPHQTFEANPAACSGASKVGFAKAITPLLPVQLEGPAYFVSYGGAKFPELVIVLQGYGVTLDLHGETFIDEHTKVTSSTFKTVPDAPVGSFELNLPEGQFSALAANTNLCGVRGGLKMPTQFAAQNGAEVKQSTPIAVTGCAPAIHVLRHSVHGGVATLTVSVPAAGHLHASGAGLTSASKRVGKAGTSTISVALSAAQRRLLAGHPGRRVKARVKLVFAPAHGKPLRTSVTVLIG
jgi:hypothetical protein